MSYKASCCCGALSLEIAAKPKLNAVCHCDNCKRRTGSAFGHSLYFNREALESVSGDFHTYELENESGKQQRHFCPDCGTTLFWYWELFQEWVGVAGGCIDSATPEPAISACHERARTWIELPDSWRRF